MCREECAKQMEPSLQRPWGRREQSGREGLKGAPRSYRMSWGRGGLRCGWRSKHLSHLLLGSHSYFYMDSRSRLTK